MSRTGVRDISHVELGRKNISLHSLITVSATLGTTQSELFADLEPKAALPLTEGEEEPITPAEPANKKGNRPTAEDVNRLLTELRPAATGHRSRSRRGAPD
jgi:hypothetical protein